MRKIVTVITAAWGDLPKRLSTVMTAEGATVWPEEGACGGTAHLLMDPS